MLALDLEEAKRLALIAVAVLVVLVVLVAVAVKSILAKVLSIVVLMGLSLLAWSQRQNVQDCAERFRDAVIAAATTGSTVPAAGAVPTTAAPAGGTPATASGSGTAAPGSSDCRVFGQDVDVPLTGALAHRSPPG